MCTLERREKQSRKLRKPGIHIYIYINVNDFPNSIRKAVLAQNTCGLLTQHRISPSPTPCCRQVQLFSGLFTCLAAWSRGKEWKRSPPQSSGKGDCRLGREFVVWGGTEGAGRWPCSPWHRGDEGAAVCAASARFSSRAAKLPGFPGMLHQGFAAALYFTRLFSLSSFLTEL